MNVHSQSQLKEFHRFGDLPVEIVTLGITQHLKVKQVVSLGRTSRKYHRELIEKFNGLWDRPVISLPSDIKKDPILEFFRLIDGYRKMVNDSNSAERLFKYYRFLFYPDYDPCSTLHLHWQQHNAFLSFTSLEYKKANEEEISILAPLKKALKIASSLNWVVRRTQISIASSFFLRFLMDAVKYFSLALFSHQFFQDLINGKLQEESIGSTLQRVLITIVVFFVLSFISILISKLAQNSLNNADIRMHMLQYILLYGNDYPNSYIRMNMFLDQADKYGAWMATIITAIMYLTLC